MFDKINYDRLVEITETEPHFRHKKGHKTKCYPWGENRGQNNKYFTRPKEGNEWCSYFDIHYAHKERVLLRVHKGNLVECMRSYYDQGDIMVLTKVIGKQGNFRQGWWSEGYQITNQNSRGGTVIAYVTDSKNKKYDIVPFQEGMIFDMKTDKPITEYDVLVRQVNRKLSAKTYEDHADDFTVLNTMLQGIGDERLAYEFCHQVIRDNPRDFRKETEMQWIEKASEKNLIDGIVCSAKSNLNIEGYKLSTKHLVDRIIKAYRLHLNEKYNNFHIKKYPCEQKYFPTNDLLKIQMREDKNEKHYI